MPLTIVTYHYVRDRSCVPARTTAELDAQLDHVAREYECLAIRDVVRGIWPERACLLTFDDGLAEHLEVVAPALERRGLRGVFCVPGRPVLERRALDAQKVQFLLGAVRDHAALGRRITELAREDETLPEDTGASPHRFDPPETAFVKRALQDGLPEERRSRVLDELFHAHVSRDERSFADEVYLTLDGCRELVRRGHELIGHGYEHRRLGLLDTTVQRSEIERSLDFVASVRGTRAFCYPYGSRNETTTRLLAGSGCVLGLTTEPRRATPDDPPLELPRIDTNDLQQELSR